MHIVKADKTDYQEIVEVWEKSVRATHHFLKENDIDFFRPLILNEYLSAVNLRCGKKETGQIIGFIGVADTNIEMLFLDPDYMGQGLGRKFLDFSIANMGAKKVDVNEQNPDAVAFYKHCGFKIIGRSSVDGMGKPFPLYHMELDNENLRRV